MPSETKSETDWSKEYPSLKYGSWFWLREGPSGTPELRQITGGRAWLEAFGMVSDDTEFLGPVRPSDLELIHTLQSQLGQLRATLAQVEQERDAQRREIDNSERYQAKLLAPTKSTKTVIVAAVLTFLLVLAAYAIMIRSIG